MQKKYKKVLYIDLSEQTFEFKNQEDLWELIGGTPVSYKLLFDYLDKKPIVISTGPLSGYFPYVSKANLLYISQNNNLVEKFGGGTVSATMNMARIDSIVIFGDTSKNIHIAIYENDVTFLEETNEKFMNRISDLSISSNKVDSQGYFTFGNLETEPINIVGNVSMSIEFAQSYELKDFFDYEKAYQFALNKYKTLKVEPANNPSCTGCPMGCELSKDGEDNENIALLPRCLISCAYAEDIYKSIPFIYLCLTSIGYDYKHEELESIPEKFGILKKNLNSAMIESRTGTMNNRLVAK